MRRLRQFFTRRSLFLLVGGLLVVGLSALLLPFALRGPSIVRVTPADGAIDANPQSAIRIEWNQWVQISSVEQAVKLDPPVPFKVKGPRFPHPGTATFVIQPLDGLGYGVHYRLTVDRTVKNLVGRTLDQPREFSFATSPYNVVTRFSPDNGSHAVSARTPLTVEFALPVVSEEEVSRAAQDPNLANNLPQPLVMTPPVVGEGRWLSPTMFGFYPDAGLQAATAYTATLRPDLTSDGRARLAQAVAWHFVTDASLVEDTRPFDGATDVEATGTVEVRLVQGVDSASVRASFSLREAGSGAVVQGTLETTDRRIIFKPSAPLARGERYEARLAPGILATGGAAINASPVTWQFTVIGDPEVVQVAPVVDAREVLTDTRRISVRFNHPIVALTNLGAQTNLPPLEIQPPLPGVGRWMDTSTYVYSPTVALSPATTYEVRVPAGLQDQTGGGLKQPFVWRFSTITPQVLTSRPLPDDQFASPRDPVKLDFNQPMDLEGLRGSLVLQRDDGTVIPGTITTEGSSATFVPTEPFARGMSYLLTVRQGAPSTGGSAALAQDWTMRFRVAPLPQLVGSTPSDGATDVEPSSGITLNFSTPMDWTTVEQNLLIEPKPTQVYTSGYEMNFSLNFMLKPETDYRVTVSADARDPYGVSLGQDSAISFRTGSLRPSLALVGGHQLSAYNAHVAARVPIRHLGTPNVAYSLYRLEPSQVPGLVNNYDAWRQYEPPDAAFVKDGSVDLPGERNEERVDLLDLGQLDPGAYYLRVRGVANYVDQQIMVVSPYGVTVKRSAEHLFVWVVDLQTGEGVPDLALDAAFLPPADKVADPNNNAPTPRPLGRTDGEGVLKAAFAASEPYIPIFLWSSSPERFAFATTNWGEGISPWEFGLQADYARPGSIVGNIATDRPIYRPDQTVHIRGAIRLPRKEGYSLPDAGQKAHLTINDPNGNVVISTTMELSEWGTFNSELVLEGSAPLGAYGMLVHLANELDENSFYGSFSVAEYRKPSFEVTVTAAKEDVVQGETLALNVEAHYFSGGAVGNAPLRWRLLGEPLYWQAESAPDFRWEDLEDAYSWYRWNDRPQAYGGREFIGEGTVKTDAQGHFTLSIPASLGKDNHSRRLILDVEVTDVDGQVIAAEGGANVHAGSFYIGLRPTGYMAQVGQPQDVTLLTLDPKGQPVGGRTLEIQVYRREWFSVREQGVDGRLYWTSRFSDTLVETQSTTTDDQGRGSMQFTPKDGGSYRISATGHDEAGHTIKASAFTWVYGGPTFWGVNDTNRVDLIADKDRYKPGDIARILVPAPYEGMTALMTIERGQVIEHKVLQSLGSSEVLEVPIRADYAPNVYVSVVLVKPASSDMPVPDLRMGLVNLPVSTEQQELTLSLTPDKEQVGPGDEVTYTVKALDHAGRGVEAEVGLALVDKAVLTLADDPNPSLKQSFYEKRPLQVFTSQSLTVLADRVTLKIQAGSKGGGGGIAADVLLRRNMPDTAYWNPSVVTDQDGIARISLKLPDNLTTWRMTGRALTTDTRVGQSTQDLVATRPLLIRPSLPRFLTVGDKLTLQAVVHNNTSSDINATVTLDPGLLKLDAPAVQTLLVKAGAQVVVRWPADVPTAGQTALRFTVTGGGFEDGVEQSMPIQRFVTPEVVATAGQVLDTTVETVQPPTTTGGQQGELNLELVPSLAGGIESGLRYLEQFPYDCSEQTVSRFLPNAVTYRLFKQLGIDDAQLRSSLETNLTAGLQRLYSLQNLDGGWGWWSNDQSNPYLTTYVVQGFVEARKAGFSVDDKVWESALGYLLSALGGDALSVGEDDWRGNARSYTLFVLSEVGRPDLGRTIALWEQRAQLDQYGRAYLLMALKTIGGQDERVKVLVGELMSSAILHETDAHWEERDADYETMSSDTRTTALALQALVRAEPNNFLVPNAVRYLMRLRQAGHWSTTQESAISLMALAEYIAQSGEWEADYNFRAMLDGRLLREGSVNRSNLQDPIEVVLSLADLQATGSQLTLQRQGGDGQTGKGRLYYTMRMHYYQEAAEVQPLDQGLAVHREYIAVDSATLTPTGQLINEAKVGDVVQVRLTLNVPENVHYLAVEDMLPAGFEALDSSLKTVTSAAGDPSLENADGEHPYWWYWGQTEVRDNRVALFATDLPKGTYHYTFLARATTPGMFQTLPATAYQMYAPEVFGRSSGAQFVVREP